MVVDHLGRTVGCGAGARAPAWPRGAHRRVDRRSGCGAIAGRDLCPAARASAGRRSRAEPELDPGSRHRAQTTPRLADPAFPGHRSGGNARGGHLFLGLPPRGRENLVLLRAADAFCRGHVGHHPGRRHVFVLYFLGADAGGLLRADRRVGRRRAPRGGGGQVLYFHSPGIVDGAGRAAFAIQRHRKRQLFGPAGGRVPRSRPGDHGDGAFYRRLWRQDGRLSASPLAARCPHRGPYVGHHHAGGGYAQHGDLWHFALSVEPLFAGSDDAFCHAHDGGRHRL